MPTKDYVNKKELPSYLIYKGQDVFEKIHELLDSKMKWIDLSKVILKANQTTPQYFKTDHHWNQNGFFLAYQEIARQMYDDGLISETPHTYDAYTWKTFKNCFLGSEGRAVTLSVAGKMEDITTYTPLFESDLTLSTSTGKTIPMIDESLITTEVYNNDYAAFLSGTDCYAKIIHRNTKETSKIIVVGISYTPPVVGLLADHFKELIYVDLRKYKKMSLNELIDREKPDAVLMLYYSGMFFEEMYTFDQVIGGEEIH